MGEMAYKICIFGESGVGKTTLARRYLTGYFEEDIKLTMGAEIFIKYVTINDIRVVLQIWDFGGEDHFRFLLPLYSRGSSAGIFMFDLSNRLTLNRIDEWLDIFKKAAVANERKRSIVMVGGKLDLQEQLTISNIEAQSIAKDYNLHQYIACSSKTGENVEELFHKIVSDLLKSQNLI